MCFHTSLTATPKQLAARYKRRDDLIRDFRPAYHIAAFSYPVYPVVTEDEELQPYKWGLIPYWVRTPQDAREIRNKTLNARSESVFDKPSYRGAIRTRRCLVPCTGFFDRRHDKGRKIPYCISVPAESIFSLAGLYDEWDNPDTGETLRTFSIITGPANELMSYIHNTNRRMPMVLKPEAENRWLDPDLGEEQIAALLRPVASREMEAWPIRNDFLRKSPYDPSILEESGEETPLFGAFTSKTAK